MPYTIEDLMAKDFNELVRENPDIASTFMGMILHIEEAAKEKGLKGPNTVHLGRIAMNADGRVKGEFAYGRRVQL